MKLRRTKERLARAKNKLSAMPDPVLCSILSKLPLNEAVATSVLSRRWRNVWNWIPSIEFDARLIRPRGKVISESTMREIDNKMESCLLHDNISSCSIVHFPNGRQISKFLSKQTKFEELSLTCCGNINAKIEIQEYTLHGNKLSVVSLTKYKINDASAFDSCPNLKILRLTQVDLVDKNVVFGEIFRRCPLLENLVLDSCSSTLQSRTLTKTIICNSTLKSLTLLNMGVVIGTIGLPLIYGIECPNLIELIVDSPTTSLVRQILETSSGLEIGDEKPILDLRVLCTTMDLNNYNDMTLLAHILDTWKNLWKINIANKIVLHPKHRLPQYYQLVSSETTFPYLEFWEAREVPRCVVYQLRVMRIRGFHGEMQEMSFVSRVINKASRLKQLVIECDDDCSRKQAKRILDLLEVKRAADAASIILKPGKEYMSRFGDDFKQWISTLN